MRISDWSSDVCSSDLGRRGQNVRLASILTGWDIDIMTEETESRRRQEEFRARSQMFIDALDVDDVIAHLLVTEGFTALEQVAFVPVEELAQIEGFDEEVAEELRARARAHLEEMDRRNEERRRELGVADELTELEGLRPAMLVILGEQGVKTLDDLADLAADELRFACSSQRGEHSLEDMGKLTNSEVDRILQGSPMGQDEANAIIMAARAHWFADEPRSEEHTSELQSLMRISYAVFCLKKKKIYKNV